MMLTKYYYVVYHVVDFAADNESICYQDAYRDHNNALLVAKDLAKCLDVIDDVYVIDGLTGEVLNTILKDAPQEDKTKEDDAPADSASAPANIYRDKNGDTWFRISDGRWRIDCSNRHCADCPYYSEEGDCIVQEPLHKADRNYQVDLARERILVAKAKAKVKEIEKSNVSTPMGETKKPKLPAFEDSLDDGTGGVWRLTDADEWDYDCTGLVCSDCMYHDDEQLCLVSNPLTKEDRDIQIESAKARMKK